MKAKRWFRPLVLLIWCLVAASTLVACAAPVAWSQPSIVLSPTFGGPGTLVTVTGSGFPVDTQVHTRLGPPSVGATPQSYGAAVAGTSGAFVLAFTMPGHWPDGTPIAEQELIVVVLNEDGSVKATAPFNYFSPPSTATPWSSYPVQEDSVVLTWHRAGGSARSCEDGTVYWSGQVEITSCGNVQQLERRQLPEELIPRLRDWARTYQGFELERNATDTADGMILRTRFEGQGVQPVSEVEKQVIQAFLAPLFAER
jgi:hypothetical protein